MPGSTVKLITISGAWHALGPDHRFTTPVNAVGVRNGSTLTGNLALVAQGDLTMGGRTKPDGSVDFTPIDHTYADDVPGATLTPEDPLAGLDEIAHQVRDSGITTVDGDVVIDARLFTPPELNPQPTPLIINDNVIDLPTGPNPDGKLPASYTGDPRVAAFVSPPYREYAKLILNVSHNLGANLALCNMAVNRGSSNCFDGFPVVHDFLSQTAKVDPTQFQLADGRGDVPVDRVTPTGLNQLLAYWLRTPDADAFRTSLPILGVSGTGALFCTTDCPAKGKVFAKPGTIIGFDQLNQQFAINAQTFAGYLEADDGHLYTFFVGVNGAAVPNIQGFFDVNDDVDEIAVILQQEACREDAAHRSDHKPVL
ncbi:MULTISPECIES: D-alanyl-D-alanine carboxypeptidase [Streptomyces]|uniref:D-alanyl-D-alanine carboxypeptidase n=1 Tax=Streptomyces TaxID=1883 RepID=UPI001F3CA21A|nr:MULTISPECIES: D-alanyl-D-alanine carboxypeptidase [Streptomyces]